MLFYRRSVQKMSQSIVVYRMHTKCENIQIYGFLKKLLNCMGTWKVAKLFEFVRTCFKKRSRHFAMHDRATQIIYTIFCTSPGFLTLCSIFALLIYDFFMLYFFLNNIQHIYDKLNTLLTYCTKKKWNRFISAHGW